MVIVHFSEYAYGGVATYLRNTIYSQVQNKKISKIILFCSEEKSENFDFKSDKFTNIRYSYSRGLFGILKLMIELKKAIALNPDIIHFHSTFAGLGRIILSNRRKYSVFYSSHGWAFLRQADGPMKHRIYAIVERLLSIKTDRIINISKFEQQAALKYKLPIEKMMVIYNSIPPQLNSNGNVLSPFMKKNTLKLGFIGRLDAPKGFPFLLTALNNVSVDYELMVIGKSVVDSDNESQQTISDKIHYLGWIDHKAIDEYFKFIDFLIVPSLWEGFGLVALEAMKNSKPVLSSDAGGLPEIIENGVNGYTFETLSVDSFKESFEKIMHSNMQQMGNNGHEIMQNKFNYQRLQNKLFVEYQVAMEKRKL